MKINFIFNKKNILITHYNNRICYSINGILWQIYVEYFSPNGEYGEEELKLFLKPYLHSTKIIVPMDKQKDFLDQLNAKLVYLKLK